MDKHQILISNDNRPDPGRTARPDYRIFSSVAAFQTAQRVQNGEIYPRAPSAVLADDDQAVTTLVRTVLEKFGVQCFVADDGERALELTRTMLPDVAVLDVRMPKCDGFGVLLALKRDRHTSGVRVVMLTGRDQEDDVMRGFGFGADDYVTKPFNPTEVAARVIRFTKPSLTPPRGSRGISA